jgi:hypothetical protein
MKKRTADEIKAEVLQLQAEFENGLETDFSPSGITRRRWMEKRLGEIDAEVNELLREKYEQARKIREWGNRGNQREGELYDTPNQKWTET